MRLTKKMRFIHWQKENAVQETPSMFTAELVEKYLSKTSIKQIQSDVEGVQNPSRAYQLIKKTANLRRGALLYCILDIDEAIDLLSTAKERKILGDLKRDLVASYVNYQDKPAERINNVLTNFAAFLQINVKDLSNRKKAKELYYTIYFSFCSAHQELSNIPFWAVSLASWWEINTQEIKQSVLVLMKQIEEKIMTLDVSEKLE